MEGIGADGSGSGDAAWQSDMAVVLDAAEDSAAASASAPPAPIRFGSVDAPDDAGAEVKEELPASQPIPEVTDPKSQCIIISDRQLH